MVGVLGRLGRGHRNRLPSSSSLSPSSLSIKANESFVPVCQPISVLCMCSASRQRDCANVRPHLTVPPSLPPPTVSTNTDSAMSASTHRGPRGGSCLSRCARCGIYSGRRLAVVLEGLSTSSARGRGRGKRRSTSTVQPQAERGCFKATHRNSPP